MPCSEINKTKLKSILQRKIFKKIDKPKELWRAVKPFGLPSKKGTLSNIIYQNIYLKKGDKICFDYKTNANGLKDFFCNLAGDLVTKLPPSANRFGLDVVRNHFQSILGLLPSKFNFSNVTEELVLQLLKDMNIDKAAGIIFQENF